MKPAIKTKSGKVVPGKTGGSHADIPAKGQHVFLSGGKVLDRKQAAVKAKVPGVKSLHSHDLKR